MFILTVAAVYIVVTNPEIAKQINLMLKQSSSDASQRQQQSSPVPPQPTSTPQQDSKQSKPAPDEIAKKKDTGALDKTAQLREINDKSQLEVPEGIHFPNEFDKHYQAPEGCEVFKSNEHMVECQNHYMRAKRDKE